MWFKNIERRTVQRPTLLELHAAIKRLEEEGWTRDQLAPSLSKHNPRITPYWWIMLRRPVPLFSSARSLPELVPS